MDLGSLEYGKVNINVNGKIQEAIFKVNPTLKSMDNNIQGVDFTVFLPNDQYNEFEGIAPEELETGMDQIAKVNCNFFNRHLDVGKTVMMNSAGFADGYKFENLLPQITSFISTYAHANHYETIGISRRALEDAYSKENPIRSVKKPTKFDILVKNIQLNKMYKAVKQFIKDNFVYDESPYYIPHKPTRNHKDYAKDGLSKNYQRIEVKTPVQTEDTEMI